MQSSLESLSCRRSLTLSLNEERRLHALQLAMQDTQRRSTYLSHELDAMMHRWHDKILLVRKALEEDNSQKVVGELVDKYLLHIIDRNRMIVDVS